MKKLTKYEIWNILKRRYREEMTKRKLRIKNYKRIKLLEAIYRNRKDFYPMMSPEEKIKFQCEVAVYLL